MQVSKRGQDIYIALYPKPYVYNGNDSLIIAAIFEADDIEAQAEEHLSMLIGKEEYTNAQLSGKL